MFPSTDPEQAAGRRFYITGGTLPPDALSYVERQADRDLLTALRDGEYCYVLNSRRGTHEVGRGKSSLCVRTIAYWKEHPDLPPAQTKPGEMDEFPTLNVAGSPDSTVHPGGS
jgi:hypothetical protein